jgi:2-hydroxy-4-carboxymuconate semialdehyde hemiacetal dehydrogenase
LTAPGGRSAPSDLTIAVVGGGAFGEKHISAIQATGRARVGALVGRRLEPTRRMAARYGIPIATTDLDAVLADPQIDAVVLCSPTPLHAGQAIACLQAGKPVQIEIPLADSLADARRVLEASQATGVLCMVGHTRRFNPSHQWIHRRIQADELRVQHMDIQTFFFRRSNTNARGEARSWTDNLLWHHAAHSVDLFAHQAGPIIAANILQGPIDANLGIPLDVSIQLKSRTGALATVCLSFNNQGPFGSTFRYICDGGTWIARYDELFTGEGVDVLLGNDAPHLDGVRLQDEAFISAVLDGNPTQSDIADVMPAYEWLGVLQQQLDAHRLSEIAANPLDQEGP